MGVVSKFGNAGGCCSQGITPLESPQPHSWCPCGQDRGWVVPRLHFSTITALGTVTTARPSLGCPQQVGMKNRLSRGGDRSCQLKAITCPCSASPSLPWDHPLPKLWAPLIHSFYPAIFRAAEETKQILTWYKAEARKKTDVGLGKRWRGCCL